MSDTDPIPRDPASSHAWHGRKMLIVADNTPEGRIALHFACRRAKATGARIILLAVIAPPEFGHWAAVEKRMYDEARQEAEATLYALARIVNEETGGLAEFAVREGQPYEEIKGLIDAEEDIRILVLGAAVGKDGPGPIVSRLASGWGEIRVPITIVPGNLDADDIAALT